MMNARLIYLFCAVVVIVGCSSSTPPDSSSEASSSSAGGAMGTGGMSGLGGGGGAEVTCSITANCTQPDNPCLITSCDFETGPGLCKTDVVPQGVSCDSDINAYPKHTCDGLGACTLAYPGANCIGASQEPTVANGCDSKNPCVKGTVVDGQCVYQISGVGTSCGADPGLMQCWTSGIVCCPVHAICSKEGAQAECANGSTCFQGQCWVDCATDADCKTTLGAHCESKTVGNVTIKTCM